MPSYTLQIAAIGAYISDVPLLEIWAEGSLHSTHSISSSGSSISVTINYGGSLPSSLSFRFNDALPEGGRTIEIQSVQVNNRHVNTGNYLNTDTLTNGASATVSLTGNDFLFDSSEPAASEFTTGATHTFTNLADRAWNLNIGTDQIFNALDGRDVIYLGAGNDKVSGGAGNDMIRGGAGTDLLFGDTGRDTIYGGTGADTIYGGAGNDRLHGQDGADELHGGAGNDRINGHDGNDILTGGLGADKLHGGAGNDFLYGDDDNDQLIGDSGSDTLDGGAGNDILYGGSGADQLDGGDGDDWLIGDSGDDVLNGGDGDDLIYGRDDNDTLHGGNNDDFLAGENGNDTLNGDAGADVLIGGQGADTLNGGAGNDVLHGHGLTHLQITTILNANPGLIFNAETNSFYERITTAGSWYDAYNDSVADNIGTTGHMVSITTQAEQDFIFANFGADQTWINASDKDQKDIWEWSHGADHDTKFWAGDSTGSGSYANWAAGEPTDADNSEYQAYMTATGEWGDGRAGNSGYIREWDAGLINDDGAIDTINGGAGNDVIYGYGGNDILNGDAGEDYVLGGHGDDTITGGADNDVLSGQNGADTINGGDGDDLISGGWWFDTLYGDAGNDTIFGDQSDDIIEGGTGDDTLYGGDDADEIYGDEDNDYINGEDGEDYIEGGTGDDVLVGGEAGDEIYGGSGADILHGHGLDQAEIDVIINNNSGVAYHAESNSFYQYVSGSHTWAAATTAAQAATLTGGGAVTGHLANITTAAENTFLGTYAGAGNFAWIGGDDADDDDVFVYSAGIEAGLAFYSGGVGGSAINNMFELFEPGHPNGADYIVKSPNNSLDDWFPNTGGTWGYMIEWNAGLINDDNGTDLLYGGIGTDTLYGYGGDDELDGGDDQDVLFGGEGNDLLYGGAGVDQLIGGNGNDIIFADLSTDYDNLVTNGSFEDLGPTGAWSTPSGWTKSGGSPSSGVLGSGIRSTDGDNSFTFGGWNDQGGAILSQNLTTVIGQQYVLTFDMGFWDNDNGFGVYETSMQVDLLDGGSTILSSTATDSLNTISNYNSYSFTFTATSTTTTLRFTDLTGSGSAQGDLDLDNIQVRAVTGSHDEIIYGGAGNDTIHSDTGDDHLYGEAGNDILVSGNGDGYLNGGDDNDMLSGNMGDDILVGGAGDDALDGGDGNDILHGHGLTEDQINTILAANSNVIYNQETNSFYQRITSSANWTTANANATSATLVGGGGVTGHLANVTSAAEDAFLVVEGGDTELWLGGTDQTVEGVWVWESGLEAGMIFHSGGSNVPGTYTNWDPGQPDGSDDHLERWPSVDGYTWNDGTGGVSFNYFIEWDAGLINDDSSVDYLYGGAGDDHLYGYGGDDLLHGGDGNDLLFAGAGSDLVIGGTGFDQLLGGAGDDLVFSGTDAYSHSDLFAVYRLEEGGGTWTDDSMDAFNSRHGVASGDVTWLSNVGFDGGNALYFDGGTGYDDARVTLPTTTFGGALTFSVWARFDNLNVGGEGWQRLWDFGNGAGVDNIFFGQRDNGTEIVFGLDDGLGVEYCSIPNSIVEGEWAHWTATIDATGLMSIYKDGLLIGQHNAGRVPSTLARTENYLGHSNYDSGGIIDATFTGAMTDFTIHTNSLDADEVYELYAHSYGGFRTLDTSDTSTTDDIIHGGDDHDYLIGNDGANEIFGGSGNDEIYGAAGDDTITGGSGDDTIVGSDGIDTVVFSGNRSEYTVSLSNNIYTIAHNFGGSDGADQVTTVENFQFADGTYTTANILAADPGTTPGTAGTTSVGGTVVTDIGASGDRDWYEVSLTGGTTYAIWARGTPTEGGTNTDPRIYNVYESDGTTVASGGDDDGGVGYESLLYFTPGSTGTYYIDLGAYGTETGSIALSVFVGGSTQNGDGNANTLNGSANADYLNGNAAGDTLNGNAGSDILEGGNGNDILDGGADADVLYGGANADTFLFSSMDAVDSIVDFTAADGDVLDISSILSGFTVGVDDIDDFVQFTETGGDTYMAIDANGTTGGSSFTTVAILEGNTGEVVQTLYDNGDIIV